MFKWTNGECGKNNPQRTCVLPYNDFLIGMCSFHIESSIGVLLVICESLKGPVPKSPGCPVPKSPGGQVP
ncbi:hypothetical protein AB205_0025940 [Aquarana catesbeiana]|uniref:Uncharacterized protein n=1 Tax=Aquarana catesbeiana TaxID=8400 RepID=A0A2G9QFX7_AQUCT|nr:hypothetical protein AB205_0025940 [Aquarana catesbeiana]